MTHILIVDDEKHIRELLTLYLKNAGYIVLEAENGIEALQQLSENVVDLVILDVMMPKLDGWELIKQIRKNDSEIPLLMISSKEESSHRIKGLSLGTDDYLAKPFDPIELMLRVRGLLKRSKNKNSEVIQFGQLKLNNQEHLIYVNEKQYSLPPKEFDLLALLAHHPNQIFTREQLISKLWGIDYDGDDRTVDVHIKRIREHTKELSSYFVIETIRGLGYKLVVKS